MAISKMKPLAAPWLVGPFDYLQELAVDGFKEAGTCDLLACLNFDTYSPRYILYCMNTFPLS